MDGAGGWSFGIEARGLGEESGLGEDSKGLLSCLQQLFSVSSVRPGQGPWHAGGVSALEGRCPRAQEGGQAPVSDPSATALIMADLSCSVQSQAHEAGYSRINPVLGTVPDSLVSIIYSSPQLYEIDIILPI